MSTLHMISPAEPPARVAPAAPKPVTAPAPAKEARAPARAAPRPKERKWLHWMSGTALIAATAAGAAGWYWWEQLHALPPGFAKANGRLEAEQVEIATKYPGRIATILVKEGDMVDQGQVIARMDTTELEAQLRAAESNVVRAQHQKTLAEAIIAQRESERIFARQELERTTALNQRGFATGELLDQRRSQIKVAQAAYEAAIADLNAAQATIEANQAEVARLKAQLDDSVLVAPKRGRIQYKLAQAGEVLSSGGRVVTLLDLSEVYMTIFVPARAAGPLALGDDARVILDPVPGYVFPANITFVATEAQFTPKMVETPEEREKLMFRVKLTMDPALRTRYENQVKTGIRGIGFVRTQRDATWPANLAVKLP